MPPERWTAQRLAELSRELDAFEAAPRTHPEHADMPTSLGDPLGSDRLLALALAVSPERSRWFWDKDLVREFAALAWRLGLR
jgi:hypothetical protein